MTTLAAIRADPLLAAATMVLADGREVVTRPLAGDDAAPLAAFLAGLSPQARALFAPHAFDRATVERVCELHGASESLRLVGVDGERVVAYGILELGVGAGELARYRRLGLHLDPGADCAVGLAVADELQGQGLGSGLLAHLVALARRLGRRRLVLSGGVQAANGRARSLYGRHGLETVGSFEAPPGSTSFDMWLDLTRPGAGA